MLGDMTVPKAQESCCLYSIQYGARQMTKWPDLVYGTSSNGTYIKAAVLDIVIWEYLP